MNHITKNIVDFSILQNVKTNGTLIQSIDIDSKYSGHQDTINSFGSEWNAFTHSSLSLTENFYIEYFDIFPLERMNKDWNVADIGCGTGRWARRIAPYVKKLYGIDPSEAINVFINNTKDHHNIVPTADAKSFSS